MDSTDCCQVEPPVILGQHVINIMRLPINDDYVAVSHALSDLLKEGWKFSTLVKGKDNSLIPKDCWYVELRREWEC